MNKTFPVLVTIASILKTVGWLLIAAGIYYGIWQGIIEPMLPKHSFMPGDMAELIGGVSAIVSGLILLFFSESVGVLLAIEKNTRKE